MEFDRLKLIVGDMFENIKSKTVLLVGVGGVGGYVLEALVRSGIGKIIIVDNDVVDITNLNRQIISLQSNIGEPKVEVAKKRANDINPNCEIITKQLWLTKENTKESAKSTIILS